MKLRLTALTLLSATFFIPMTAQAGGHTTEKFMQADTDKNGLVSKEEFTAKYEDKYTKMDGDADGNVSPDEYEAYMDVKYEEHYKEKFNKMDTNGDGMVSLEEMSAYKKSHKHKH